MVITIVYGCISHNSATCLREYTWAVWNISLYHSIESWLVQFRIPRSWIITIPNILGSIIPELIINQQGFWTQPLLTWWPATHELWLGAYPLPGGHDHRSLCLCFAWNFEIVGSWATQNFDSHFKNWHENRFRFYLIPHWPLLTITVYNFLSPWLSMVDSMGNPKRNKAEIPWYSL